MAKRLLFLLATTASVVHGVGNNNETSMTHVDSCDLNCANGGYCTLVEGTEVEIAKQAQSGRLIEVCVCRPGFTGVACEVALEECALPERLCHNNKVPCTKQLNGEWGCDCSLAASLSNFAGRMCRKPITEYCTGKFDPDSALSFCTNGGRCLADFIAAKLAPGDTTVNRKYQHAGCSCPPEFHGPHCEFLKMDGMDEAESPSDGNGQSTNRKVQSKATVIWMVLMASCTLVLAALGERRRRQNIAMERFRDGLSTTSNGTYIDNAIDFADEAPHDGPNQQYNDSSFTSWAYNSGSQLPTVLETVTLD